MRILNKPTFSFWRTNHLPVLLQTEAAECGLACLGMVACFFGKQVDLVSMRSRFTVSLKGLNLKGLMSMAYAMQMQPRPLKLEMEQLSNLQTPCILHWDMSHFVVLESVTAHNIVIHDPAVGKRRLSLKEAGKHFTGVALELTPTSQFQKADETKSYSLFSLVGHVVGLKGSLTHLLLLGAALQVCALVAPFYMQWVVDEALLAADRELVTVLGMGFLLLVLIQTGINGVRSWITTVLATSLNFQWLGNAFAHLMRLPLPYFEKRHTGDIVSRFGSIQVIQRALTTQFIEGVIDGLLVFGTLAMMLVYSPSLASISIAALGLYVLMRWLLFRPLRDATAEQIIHAAKQQTMFIESVRGIQSIRLFNRTEERRGSWLNTVATQFNADLRIARLSISYQTANTFLQNTERVLVVWVGALAVLDHQLSVGMLFAFVSYKDQFSQRVASLVDKFFEFRMLRLHCDRVADIVMANPEEELYEPEVAVGDSPLTLEIRDLSFRYSDSEPYVIRNFNLTIPAGQCVALTGPSGCGKTTLIKLILGLLEPTQGEVLVGGAKVSQLGMRNFRELLGTVMQEDNLFSGSIAENISFFDPVPRLDHVHHCARLAAVYDEIISMPMGFNTLIGDIGSGLSGGQRQRLLLARALYRDPKILVLDEATSHLDVHNEKLVNAAIGDLQLTRLIIAHRTETISMAQRVVSMLHGAVVSDQIKERPLLEVSQTQVA